MRFSYLEQIWSLACSAHRVRGIANSREHNPSDHEIFIGSHQFLVKAELISE